MIHRFAVSLIRHRSAAGLTQHELATRTGVSVRAIRDLETGRVDQPRAETLRRLRAVLPLLDAQPARPRLDVLGPLRLTVDGSGLRPRRASRALLALLGLSAGDVVGRDEIVWYLWGERPPPSHATQIHAAVNELRRAFDPAVDPRASTAIRLVDGGYLLEPSRADVDLTRFDALSTRARADLRGGHPVDAFDALGRALSLWRGPALAGLSPALVTHPRARGANAARVAAALLHARAGLELGRHAEVVGPLEAIVTDEPYHEPIHAALVRALAGAGERGQALRVYADLRTRLADELGVHPGEDVQLAHLDVLRADRLLATSTAPHVVPAMLPPDVADFTGRAEDLATLESTLTTVGRGGVVAAIAGMAGVGKTALAVRAAHTVADRFPDGQLYASLGGTGAEPADVLALFLRALGVDSRAIPDDVQGRIAMYRTLTASRRILVVVDGARAEHQIRPLLPASASCAALLTSRARLTTLEGARWTDLDVLQPHDAVDLLGRVVGDRVHHDPAAAGLVVRLCGGLPLAVRVAGARIAGRPTWRLADLVDLLTDERRRLDNLSAGDLAVRTSLAMSYHGVSVASRTLLRRLSLLDVPDFAPFAISAVGGTPAELDELIDSQLLAAVGMDVAGQQRYRFHDLVRLYARERTEVEDTDRQRSAAIANGLGGWLVVAEAFVDQVPGPCYATIHGPAARPAVALPPTEPLAWFEAEHLAIMAGIRQACADGLLDLAFDLAGCLEKYLDLRGMYAEWRATNEHVLDACVTAGHLRGQAVMLRGLIDVRTWNSTDADAMSRSRVDAVRAAALFAETGDARGQADAEVVLSWAEAAEGDAGAAKTTARHALDLAARTGHVGGQARAHVALAVALREEQRWSEVIAHLGTALDLARALGNPRYEASVLHFLGLAHLADDAPEASRDVLADSLAITQKYRDHYAEALTRLALARLHLATADPAAARAAAQHALSIGRTYNMPHHTAEALQLLGETDLREGMTAPAIVHIEDSVALWRTRGWPSFLADALTSLGAAHAASAPEVARGHYTEALQLYRRIGNHVRARALEGVLETVAANEPSASTHDRG